MAHFVGHVVVEQDNGWWILREPLRYVEETGLTVTVPEGFVTDFASIPRVFWNILSPEDAEYSAASICHDRLYESHELPRRQADGVFFRAMVVNGTPHWKRVVMWCAVRLGGAGAYRTGPARQLERRTVYLQRAVVPPRS